MSAQHSPGPWWIDDDGFIASGSGDTYLTIAEPHCMDSEGRESEIQANAQLIAAAPELLAALKEMLEAYAWKANETARVIGEENLHSAVRAARKAIAAAEAWT